MSVVSSPRLEKQEHSPHFSREDIRFFAHFFLVHTMNAADMRIEREVHGGEEMPIGGDYVVSVTFDTKIGTISEYVYMM